MKCECAIAVGIKALNPRTLHHRRIVRIRHDRALRAKRMGIGDHAKKTFIFYLAIDGPGGIEYFVSAMLGVGLCKHHQFDVSRIACDAMEVVEQIIDFID